MQLRVLTIWQPWASLITMGAKPYEFRKWDYRERERALVGQRIAIHAGVREAKLDEVEDVIGRYRQFGVLEDLAAPALERLATALRAEAKEMPAYRAALREYRRRRDKPRMVGDPPLVEPIRPNGQTMPLAAILGTAILRAPRRCTELFGGQPDSDRIDHHMWAWPLTDIEPWMPAVPAKGAQGFWQWAGSREAA